MYPSPDVTTSLARIRRASKLLAVVCLGLIVSLPVIAAVYWLLADAASLAAGANLPPGIVQNGLMVWQRIAGALLTEVPLALLLIGVWQARKCFLLFARDKFFTLEVVGFLKRFAGWAAASAMAEIVAKALISVVLTMGNAAGMRHLAIGIGSDQLFLLLFAGMVWLMAGVINEGKKLAEENASFI